MRLARVNGGHGLLWARLEGGDAFAVDRPGQPDDGGRALGPLSALKLLAPIEANNKVVGLLDNFDGRKGRAGPGLFLKPMTCVIATGEAIVWPEELEAINFEAELAVVIGRTARNVSQEHALDHVRGYTVANDVTSFPVLMQDGPASLSTRFKFYDSFLPLGPWIETDLDPATLELSSTLNGAIKQQARTADMAFSVPETIAWISRVMTLDPGDVICMGTPPGFVPMARGDSIQCRIDGIGVLENHVV